MQKVDTWIQEVKKVSLWKDLCLVVFSSLLIGLCSKIAIPLFFTPVPVSLLSMFILLFSVLLGSKRAFSVVFCLLGQAVIGLPVLSSGAGLAVFVGPTAGYIFGYLVAAFLTGFIFERSKEKTAKKAFLAIAAGNLTIYLLGAGYLASFIGFKSALLLGIVPFVFGDLLKTLVSVKLLERLGAVSEK